LGSRHQRAEVRAAIVVHRKDASGEQTVRISFEGPAPNIEGALTAAIASLPTGTGEAPATTGTAPAAPRPTPKRSGTKKRKQLCTLFQDTVSIHYRFGEALCAGRKPRDSRW
jgi:hypothetical protein